MSVPNDDELRARFAELRAFDSSARPEFAAGLARGKQRVAMARARPVPAPTWIAAAAVILAIGAAGVAWKARQLSRPSPATTVVQSITIWRSPTASLLRTTGRELYAPPPILSSIIDGATHAPVQRKGAGS
jgi:hypothetical protein